MGYDRVCIRVIHANFGEFISYLDFLLWLFGDEDVEFIEVIILGANDDEPLIVELSPEDIWWGKFGLRESGEKEIVSVVVHFTDGGTEDITDMVGNDVGVPNDEGYVFDAPFPGEPEHGDCTDAPPTR